MEVKSLKYEIRHQDYLHADDMENLYTVLQAFKKCSSKKILRRQFKLQISLFFVSYAKTFQYREKFQFVGHGERVVLKFHSYYA